MHDICPNSMSMARTKESLTVPPQGVVKGLNASFAAINLRDPPDTNEMTTEREVGSFRREIGSNLFRSMARARFEPFLGITNPPTLQTPIPSSNREITSLSPLMPPLSSTPAKERPEGLRDVPGADPLVSSGTLMGSKDNVISLDVNDYIQRLLDVGYTRKVNESLCLKNTEIVAICQASREIFLSQPTLIELSPPVKIFGDVHGQYLDLIRFFEYCGFPPASTTSSLATTSTEACRVLRQSYSCSATRLNTQRASFCCGVITNARTSHDVGAFLHGTSWLPFWLMIDSVRIL